MNWEDWGVVLTLSMLALVGVTFLFGGFVKGAIGLGLPVVALAILAPVLGVQQALALFLIPAITTNLWQALAGPALPMLLRRLWPFLLAAAAGIGLGSQVLAGGDSAVLEVLLGGLLIAYSAVSLLTPQLPPPGRAEGWMSPLAGGLGGLMFGMSGVFIVPGILYLQTLGLRRDVFVQALGITFVTISTALAVSMAGHSLVSLQDAALSAAGVPPTVLGLWLGRRMRHRISEDGFRRIFFLALIGVGAFMIWWALSW